MAVEPGEFVCEQSVDELVRACHGGGVAGQEGEREGTVEEVAEGEEGAGGGGECEDQEGGEELMGWSGSLLEE